MRIGIGLPTTVRGVTGETLVSWARRAEDAGFASLGAIDRLVYDSYDPMLALTAAAAVTARIELVSNIVIGPVRVGAVLAKEAATLDHLSGGRLTLGVGIGARADDYTAAGCLTTGRGKKLDAQLDELRRIWAGERRGTAGRIGPTPIREAGPDVLIGGDPMHVAERVARYGDGWTSGGGGPDGFARVLPQVLEAWQAKGREGRPRTQALCYFGLGPRAAENVQTSLGDYYGFAGPYAESLIASAPKDEGAMRDLLARFEQTGVDEVVCFPTSIDPEQVDLLAGAVL
jgi:alkanesulfonate monooxygenase SsuD/methylene tetrahydromethanopterin reductase-like flavin-dependent oxidoreductase (luciferase family)